jgi:hypothetical protein
MFALFTLRAQVGAYMLGRIFGAWVCWWGSGHMSGISAVWFSKTDMPLEPVLLLRGAHYSAMHRCDAWYTVLQLQATLSVRPSAHAL